MLSALTDFGRRRIRHFPVYRQHDMMDCGPSCLRMVARHHGKSFDLPLLRERCSITRQGVSLLGISEAAESVGLRTVALKVSPERLERLPVPFIAWWKQNHYVVVYDVTRHFVYVSDPAHGRIRYTRAEFCQHWAQPGQEGQAWGAALLLEPTPRFYAQADRTEEGGQLRSFVSAYVRRYRSLFAQVALGLLVTGLIGLAFPLLTQLLIDYGIGYRDLNFIYLVLGAQFMLFAGRIAIDMLRSWLLLHIGVRISVSIVSDFLAKLMRVRLKFFDTVHIGDIITRINDHSRIEFFLTSTTLGTAFSLIYVSALVAVMFFYNAALATLFFGGAVLTALWILAFVRKRAELNHRHFSELAETQTSLVTIVEGIRDIKISRSERQKRWEWEGIQAKIFDIKSRSMTLAQLQSTGATILSESKDMLVSLIAAKAVIDGEMTLGMMMALTYVMGQVNAPLQQLIPLLQSAQDAKLGAERLHAIQLEQDEERHQPGDKILPHDGSIWIDNLSFRYGDAHSPWVLKDVSFFVPDGSTCAIVGASGCGKTTLLNLLLKFYDPTEGQIVVGNRSLQQVAHGVWRGRCGAVMQGGHIFPDTILKNITLGDDDYDPARVEHAAEVAQIRDFVEALPLGYHTKIGAAGLPLSGGQNQRLLIARVIYRNPHFVFFDEATSALDAANERRVMHGLQQFSHGRTVVVVAHRLSTVRDADQIVVLDKGRVVETGNHDSLTAARGHYFNLVRNQLELGA